MTKQQYLHYVILFLNELQKKKYLKHIFAYRQYTDEPKLIEYSAVLHNSKRFSDGSPNTSSGLGMSINSNYSALFKCVAETIERLCQVAYKETDIVLSSFKNLSHYTLDPLTYVNKEYIQKKQFGWVQGYDLLSGKACFIPAQLIYLNYKKREVEGPLTEVNTTGSAGGFTHESTLLRAIYELLERDAFMTTYLIKAPVARLDIDSVISKLSSKRKAIVTKILNDTLRYNFELMLFDITTDIPIPVFMAVLIDKTGIGPGFTIGTKASLDSESAIIGSIEESFLCRPWLRFLHNRTKKRNLRINPDHIKTLEERGLYWYSLPMLKKLSYLLSQKPQKIAIKLHTQKNGVLTEVKEMLKKNKIRIFYADVTLANFKDMGFLVYKTVSPDLQTLTLTQKNQVILHNRLKNVARHFGLTKYTINRTAQPFL